MEERVILNEDIEAFGRYLFAEEKAENTVEKYMRDVRSFFAFAKNDSFKLQVLSFKNGDEKTGVGVTKDDVIAYKKNGVNAGDID